MSSSQITFDRRALLHEITELMRRAAETHGLEANTDAMAVMVTGDGVGINIPDGSLADLDIGSLLAGQALLDGRPLMYWLVAAKSATPTEFLTVVADQTNRTVSLRRLDGEILAQGDLVIEIRPSDASVLGTELLSVLGVSVEANITKLNFGKNSFEMCGNLTISAGPIDVNIEGCMEVTKSK
jgi:hypothetical protein